MTKEPRPDIEPLDHKKIRRATKVKPSIKRTSDPGIKKAKIIRYCFSILSIVILLAGILISYQNYSTGSAEPDSLEKTGYNLMIALVEYDDLVLEPDRGLAAWDVNRFLGLSSDDITTDLLSGFDHDNDLEFLIQIHDLSEYPVKYDRTTENGLSWSSVELSRIGSEKSFTISTTVNIFVSVHEVHLARLSVTVW